MTEECFKVLPHLLKLHTEKQHKNEKSHQRRRWINCLLRFLATERSFEELKFTAVVSPQALA
jgi:hypothetical protein